jgi:chromosome segregation ATPase
VSVSVSESGGDHAVLADIVAGTSGFEARLRRFREDALQADEAKAMIRKAHALMAEAEARIAQAETRMREVETAAAKAKAEHDRIDDREAEIEKRRARLAAWAEELSVFSAEIVENAATNVGLSGEIVEIIASMSVAMAGEA